MAIYHLSAKILSRSKGKNSLRSIAYISGEKIYDERTGQTFDYTNKKGVDYKEILAPEDAPSWVYDRRKLWSEVEKREDKQASYKTAQVARQLDIALPKELNFEQQKELSRKYIEENFVSKGMIADFAIHHSNGENPHIHVQLTMREMINGQFSDFKNGQKFSISKEGKTKKQYNLELANAREWNKKETLKRWRENWTLETNRYLEKLNINEKIDHRTLKEQGIDREAQIHVGVNAMAIDKKYNSPVTERGKLNNEIKKLNQDKVINIEKLREISEEMKKVEALIKAENEARKDKYEVKLKAPMSKEEMKHNAKDYADIENAEQILKEEFSKQSALKFINQTDANIKELKDSISSMKAEKKNLQEETRDIKYKLDMIQKYKNTLNTLETNILGRYKDKYSADYAKSGIASLEKELEKINYTDGDLNLKEDRLININKNLEKSVKEVKDMEQQREIVHAGLRGYMNQEVNEWSEKYKSQFEYAKYIDEEDMGLIKNTNDYIKHQYGKDIIAPEEYKSYMKLSEQKLRDISGKIAKFKELNESLEQAKYDLHAVEEYKDVAKKFESRFTSTKYKYENEGKKYIYDSAKKRLDELGISNLKDLEAIKKLHANDNVKVQKLEESKNAVKFEIDVYRECDGIINKAARSAEKEMSIRQKAYNLNNKENSISYDEFKESPGENIFLKVNDEQLDKIKEMGIKYSTSKDKIGLNNVAVKDRDYEAVNKAIKVNVKKESHEIERCL